MKHQNIATSDEAGNTILWSKENGTRFLNLLVKSAGLTYLRLVRYLYTKASESGKIIPAEMHDRPYCHNFTMVFRFFMVTWPYKISKLTIKTAKVFVWWNICSKQERDDVPSFVLCISLLLQLLEC